MAKAKKPPVFKPDKSNMSKKMVGKPPMAKPMKPCSCGGHRGK